MPKSTWRELSGRNESTWRGLEGQAAIDCERAERRQMRDHLAATILKVAATTAREVIFYRAGYPATVPAWAQAIADDRTVVNLRTVLAGAYLNDMVRDEEHAVRHSRRRLHCPHCIAREET
jgi:hypothetical protein